MISAISYAQEKYIFLNIRPVDDPEFLETFNEFEENTDRVVGMSSTNVDKLSSMLKIHKDSHENTDDRLFLHPPLLPPPSLP